MRGLKEIFIHVLCLSILMLAFSGCGSKEQTQESPQQKSIEPAKEKKSTMKPSGAEGHKEGSQSPAEQGKPIDQTQEYSYDAQGKPDPFEPLVAALEPSSQEKGAPVDRTRADKPLTPLQRFDISDLFLVAVVLADNNPTALIEDNAHNGYIVREGMIIGKNDGVIKKILKDRMIVEEKISDSAGNIETKITTLTMHTKD